jgi:hypothetical protein
MIPPQSLQYFCNYIPKNEWNSIYKVAIKYDERKWLKWMALFKLCYYKKYTLKVTYKNKEIRYINLTIQDKNILKPLILKFNFYVGNYSM